MSGEQNGRLRNSILSRVGVLQIKEATMPGEAGDEPILVRELTGKQSREFEEMIARRAPAPLGFLLQLSIIDPTTKELVFEPADREALEALGISALKPVVAIAQELNGISDADIEKAKEFLLATPPSE